MTRTYRNRKSNRSISRSPSSNRWYRHVSSSRGNPDSSCLGVFGMSLHTTERALEKEFMKFGHLQKVKVIRDLETGRSRGFAFVYFDDAEDARAAREAMHGKKEIDGHTIRIDYSVGKRGSATPHRNSVGRSYYSPFQGRYERRPHGGYYGCCGHKRSHRSPSPIMRRDSYRRRSRSRSYSPRR